MNLIIVTTPFQMIIAEKIIEQYPKEEFHLIVLTSYYNDKYLYYFEKLKIKCKTAKYIKTLPKNKSKIFTLIDLLRLKIMGLFLFQYNKIFLANIESIWIQVFISNLYKKSKIYTFDDGSANIIKDSYLYNTAKLSNFSSLILNLIGNKFSLDEFKKLSELHFTIYKDIDNIIKKTKYIPIYKKEKYNFNSSNINMKENSISIFLGQPIYEFDNELFNEIEKILSYYNIEYYFSHPREIVGIHNNIKYIQTHLVFEDYILSKLMDNPNIIVNVYTLYSGTLLNLNNIPNINLIAIKPRKLPSYLIGLYPIYSQLGVHVISI